jgi:hypothetical protein
MIALSLAYVYLRSAAVFFFPSVEFSYLFVPLNLDLD